jgi:glucan phosphoethanolaminetransferase (alkaline phosphatase superfamily)
VLKSDGTKNNKIAILTGLLQGIYLLLFFTELIGKIGQINIYIAFGICAIISIICFLLSIWLLLPFSKFKHGIKYLFIFFAVIQIFLTIFIYLFPEAGIPAPIQF